VNVEPVDTADDELAAAVARLVPQLSESRTPPTREATTGSPAAIASTTTRPKVSSAEGKTKISALAYACESASPCM